MKHCVHCGRQLNDKAQFCSQCGKPVAPGTSPAPSPAAVKKKKKIGPLGCLFRLILLAILAFAVYLFWPSSGAKGLVFAENFDDNGNDWNLGAAEIRDSRYNVRAAESFLEPFGPKVKNGALEGTVGFISGDPTQFFGLLVRVAEEQHILFAINGSSEYLINSTGIDRDVHEKTTLLTTGAAQHLRIDFAGRMLFFTLNGTRVAEIYAGDAAAGPIFFDSFPDDSALFVAGGCEAFFDDINLYDNDRAQPNLRGKVLLDEKGQPLAEIRISRILDEETFNAAPVGSVLSDVHGDFALNLPTDGIYILEVPGLNTAVGGRITDLRIPGDGLNLDIKLEEGN